MKSWKKGAFIGVIWGPLSGLYLFLSGAAGFAGLRVPPRPFLDTIFGKIFMIPMRGAAFLDVVLIGDTLIGKKLKLILILFIFPSIIGALIGSMIGFVIEKYKHYKNKDGII